MDIKDILLFLRTNNSCAAEIGVAARLARQHGARVSGVALTAEPKLPAAETYAAKVTATDDVLAELGREIRGQATSIEAAFHRSIIGTGCAGDWSLAGPGETPQTSVLRTRLVDLVIVGQPEPDDQEARRLTRSLVISSGSPCLIVPEATPNDIVFDRVLIAWDGSRAAKRALHDGLAFLRRASAVEILVVDREPATGESADEALLGHLSRHGVRCEVHRACEPGDASQAIRGRCGEFRADLLVMGAYGHSRIAEALLRGATRWALSEAAIPVLMSH